MVVMMMMIMRVSMTAIMTMKNMMKKMMMIMIIVFMIFMVVTLMMMMTVRISLVPIYFAGSGSDQEIVLKMAKLFGHEDSFLRKVSNVPLRLF